jgi:hypothetical protein
MRSLPPWTAEAGGVTVMVRVRALEKIAGMS